MSIISGDVNLYMCCRMCLHIAEAILPEMPTITNNYDVTFDVHM